jgi:hypothetical protein
MKARQLFDGALTCVIVDAIAWGAGHGGRENGATTILVAELVCGMVLTNTVWGHDPRHFYSPSGSGNRHAIRTLTVILIVLLTTAQAAAADRDMTARFIERAKTMSLPLLGLDNLGRRPEGVRAYAVTFDASNIPGAPISTLSFAVRIWDGDDEGKLDGALDAIERDLNRIIENIREGRTWNQGFIPR